jgi:hypothetical protein
MIMNSSSEWHVHHHNDIMDFTCKGYSVENREMQNVCGKYIDVLSINLSNIYEK